MADEEQGNEGTRTEVSTPGGTEVAEQQPAPPQGDPDTGTADDGQAGGDDEK
jgi:hypothetical protein